ANITIPAMGPSTINSLRFDATFITPSPSFRRVRRCRARAGQPLALELTHVGDDRPPVRWRGRPAVSGHQSEPVRDDVEDLPVGVLQDLLLMERGGGDVAPLK